MFALLILIEAGVRTIITSSSDAKLAGIKKLSPLVEGINYRTTPDVAAEVRRLTGGRGANIVVNNVGVPSIPDNLASLAYGGTISLVGFLDGLTADWSPGELMGIMAKRGYIKCARSPASYLPRRGRLLTCLQGYFCWLEARFRGA